MVDWDRFGELREEIGDDDCDEVVELFFLEVEEAIGRLMLPGSAAEREADLHFLKGSAVNLGFTSFGSLCARGELRASQGTIDDSEVRAVIDSYRKSRVAFEEGRAKAA